MRRRSYQSDGAGWDGDGHVDEIDEALRPPKTLAERKVARAAYQILAEPCRTAAGLGTDAFSRFWEHAKSAPHRQPGG